MEKNLQPVELAVLNRVATQVHLCKERQVLYIGELAHFTDVVQLDSEEPQALGVLEAFQLWDLVFRYIEGFQDWQIRKAWKLAKPVLLEVEFLDEESVEVFDGVNWVAIQGKDLQLGWKMLYITRRHLLFYRPSIY